jgi:hypothetical protein
MKLLASPLTVKTLTPCLTLWDPKWRGDFVRHPIKNRQWSDSAYNEV